LEAPSGSHALEVWEQANRPIDLLLTDLVMPGGVMGSELAERLSRQSPNLKVIYTSGYSPGMAGKDASLLAKRNFLPKPYSIGKLAEFVRECLDAPAGAGETPFNPDVEADQIAPLSANGEVNDWHLKSDTSGRNDSKPKSDELDLVLQS
jgi:DNA-binding NtrC family response regulator